MWRHAGPLMSTAGIWSSSSDNQVKVGIATLLVAAVFSTPATAQVRDTVRQILPDTVVARPVSDSTRRSLRLCSAGDVTLGSNLDSLWARSAAANLWDR